MSTRGTWWGVMVTAVVIMMAGIGESVWGAENEPRTITVSATASIKLTPDSVTVVTQVVTTDKDPVKAQSANDAKVKEALAVVTGAGVPAKDVNTGYASLEPQWRRTRDDERIFEGYRSTKQINIVLRDLSKYEGMIAGMLKAGVNQIDSITFGTSKEIEMRRSARVMAVKAAKEKATYMVEVLGQKVGKPLSISEQPTESWYDNNDIGNRNLQVEVAGPDEPDATTGTLAPGNITVRARVHVVFELAD